MKENENESIKEEAPPESFIQIVFVAPGSVVFNMQVGQVTPLQILAIAKYLELEGENALIQQKRQAEQSKIIVPKPVLQ